ncbi:MAG TPA: hypothetical protein VGP44_06155, partial [Gemmatimonadales bacterium]|nr:hypothetical protein [Gemmatimonadales bacterium]
MRMPLRILHQTAPQRLDLRMVTLALPVIPGRHPSRAGSRSRTSTARGVAEVEMEVTTALTAEIAPASGRRLAAEPCRTSVP